MRCNLERYTLKSYKEEVQLSSSPPSLIMQQRKNVNVQIKAYSFVRMALS